MIVSRMDLISNNIWEIIHAVEGYNFKTIRFEKFNKYIQKKF